MARAQGARALMALAFETTYGTPPASGFTRMPFASNAGRGAAAAEQRVAGLWPRSAAADQGRGDGGRRCGRAHRRAGVRILAEGGVRGACDHRRGGPYTHEFQSGSWTLPSMSIETGMPEVPRYAMYSGCVLDQITWQMQRSGLLTATARLVAQGETVAPTSAFGEPASHPPRWRCKRFGHFNGAITRNGTALGNVVSAEITYANNLDRIETIRSDGRIDGADPSIAALTGRIEVRFADQVLVDQAWVAIPARWNSPMSCPRARVSPSPCTPSTCRARASRFPGRRACRPALTGRPRATAPSACAPPP